MTKDTNIYEGKTTSWRGNTIAYYDEGVGHPLLMLHGWGGSSYDFVKMIPGLESSFRILIPDLPGSGFSSKPRIHYDFDFFLDFLEEFLQSRGVGSFHLAGHSLGGHLAVLLIKRNLERVDRLILLAPTGLVGQEGFNGLLSRLGSLVELGFRLNNRWLVRFFFRRNVFYDPAKIDPEYLERSYRNFLTREARYSISSITRDVVGTHPLDHVLPTLSNPTLILWGANDRLFPYRRWGPHYQRLLSQARLIGLENCGHNLVFERPEDVLKETLPFLLEEKKSIKPRF